MAGWLESLCEQPGCLDTSQDARSPTCQDKGCPCIYETKPILRLRGFCPGTHLEHQSVYVPMQVKTNPTIIILLGLYHSGIVYNPLVKKWMITNTYRNVEARTDASQISYALGKQKWTITNDTDTQWHKHTMTQTHNGTNTQWHKHTMTQTHNDTDTQWYKHICIVVLLKLLRQNMYFSPRHWMFCVHSRSLSLSETCQCKIN